MILILSKDIKRIDNYAEKTLAIPKIELMARSGRAVAQLIKERLPKGASIVILAGKGNNGGDGYALAALVADCYKVCVYDVFSSGQSSEEGKHHLAVAKAAGVPILSLREAEEPPENIRRADCVVDAIFGVGFRGELPDELYALCELLNAPKHPLIIAVDLPLGINADNGTAVQGAIHADITVVLSYMKLGLLSYPAREYVGEVVHASLDLPEEVESVLAVKNYLIDKEYARLNLPVRAENTNKGTFGKLSIYAGSERYRGAASLALGAALRFGVGLCEYKGPRSLCDILFTVYPEAIYSPLDNIEQISMMLEREERFQASLIGCGSDTGEMTEALVRGILTREGAPVILDADAINVLARLADGKALLKNATRKVILTPHPLELARLIGISVDEVQSNRIDIAKAFARECGVVLVLKGAATLVTDGDILLVNSTGSSALAKGGSGDVLAGALASLVAMGTDPIVASALAVYIHGLAADRLSMKYSTFGVTPSDLPLEMAQILAQLQSAR